MKHSLLLLVLLLTSVATYAQTAFTKATLDGILKEYQKDPHGFFERYCPPDFRYINRDGSFAYLQELLKGSLNSKVLANEIQDQKIVQSGDVAVVSGIHVADRIDTDGTKYNTRIACTYTFQRQKGNGSAPRWMFVASHQSNVAKDSPK